jgi:hypothetical protein
MMQWPNDWNKVAQATGLELMLQPVNDYVNWIIDCNTWTFMQLWAAPFCLPGNMKEIEQWTQTVSLNGIRSWNICNAN